jgi:hypothetical protein
MIKPKPPRYQALIERSIAARGFKTEKYYVIDSRNERADREVSQSTGI